MANPILIVENDQDFRQMLQEIVEGIGFTVVAVDRATEALKIIKDQIISLILLDIKMPKVHGDDFLRFIRKQGTRIPVVVISGYLTPEVLEVLRENGVSQVIVKPFKVQRVAQAVIQVMEEA